MANSFNVPSPEPLCNLESCLIQDEPGEGSGFSHKMSLEGANPHAGN
jgi:hypothetical protein